MSYHYQIKQSKNFLISLITVLALSATSLFAQDVKYSDSWGDAGYTLKQSDNSGLEINFSVTGFSIAETVIDGEPVQNVFLPGTLLPNDEGAPDLPGTSRYVAVPQGATPKLIIRDFRIEKFQNVTMAPAPRIPLDTEDGPLDYNKDQAIYSKDAFYPANPIQISEPTLIRGIDAVMVGITPFQYNPVTKELIVYRDVEVEIVFEGGTGHFGSDRLRNRWWDPIVQDVFLNSASLPEMDYNKMRQQAQNLRDDAGCEYLIVVPNNPEFSQWADSIKLFRQKQGILTNIVTLDDIGSNTVSGLENYFNNAYNTWDIPPAAVLLLADYGTNANSTIIAPIWDNYCASDNIFADVNNNKVPDMIFARITANNASQLEVMVTKFINYERNPPTNPNFYNHPITALGWQTERWFQICSETVGGFWNNALGKETVRINAIYVGNPSVDPWSTATNTYTVLNVFGPNGLGYIPASPSALGGWSGGNANMVNNAINNGAFMLQHRDHGYEQGWGEPGYSSSNINGLNNTDLCFVFSINCLTGKYNMSSECFAEKFHRYTKNGNNSGALGVIAASEVSYSFVNDTYVWGMYDNMWPDFLPDYGMPVEERGLLPAFANASGKYFLKQSSWPYNTGNKEVTYNLFHHHGGAFLTVYSEVPQDLGVAHEQILFSGETTFAVSADPGSFIALTVDGEIIGTAEGTGFMGDIQIEPQIPETQVVVTVTKQNYYRYESVVEVIVPEGCHVIYNSYTIDDSQQGNGNGMMDYGETILLDMTVENVGVSMAENIEVTISSQSEYISIINGASNFGNIGANSTHTEDGAFEIQVYDNIPDLAIIEFELSATDGEETWESPFAIEAHAPIFEVSGDVLVSDPDGNNNGRLDPGETADIHVPTVNIGTGNAYTVHSSIWSGNPFIVINSIEHDLDMIGAGEVGYAVFNVSLHEQAVIGSLIETTFNSICDATTIEQGVMLKVGALIEDFETGDLSEFAWQVGGGNPWFVTDEVAYEGNYSIRSGAINDGQMCILGLSANVELEDTISFYRKTSTESGDVLQFYIDGAMMGEWSGELDWGHFSYPVTPGTHNFMWRYDKDGSQTGGDDCVWIDLIEFPTLVDESLMAFAGQDAEICEGDGFQANAAANNYQNLMWASSGTGTFDDNTTLNPVYTPGNEDIQMGYVTLTISAIDGGDEESDEMILTIKNAPSPGSEPPVGESYLCLNPGTVSYTIGEMAGADEYIWAIIPEEAGNVTWEGTEAQVEFDPEFTGAGEIKVKGVNECGEGDWSTELSIQIWSTPDVLNIPEGLTDVCAGEVDVIYTVNNIFNADEIIWELDPPEAGIIDAQSFMATVSWAEDFGSTASLRAKPINYCADGEWSESLVVNIEPLPVASASISGKVKTCMGSDDIYEVSEISYTNTYEWALEPETAGVLEVNGMECTVLWDESWNGGAIVKVRGLNDCGEGGWSPEYSVLVEDCTGIEEMNGNGFSVYPNPNSGVFNIVVEADDIVSIQLFSSLGKLMFFESEIKVDGYINYTMDGIALSEGLYYLTVKGSEVNFTRKVIISK